VNLGKTLFAQIMDFLPWKRFHRIVARRNGDNYVKHFSCAEQFRVMAFAQLSYRESLRDIELCLGAQVAKLYHMGMSAPVKRATLADANERRDWRIFAEFAQCLIDEARGLYREEPFGIDLAGSVYAFDASTIDLCLSLFPWAHFGRAKTSKASIKLHTLLDLRGNIPSFIHLSTGRMADVRGFDKLSLEAGAIYVMDRGYLDFTRLYRLHEASAFFVSRPKHNTQLQRSSSMPSSPATRAANVAAGICSDCRIRLTGKHTSEYYPERLRRIHLIVPETGKQLVLLTNNFKLSAVTIAALYKARWQVELFFKWIKQHLRIKKFYGTTENAVKTQIWIAVSIYVLIAIIKKRLKLAPSLYGLLQLLSLTLFEKTTLQDVLQGATTRENDRPSANQLNLFEF
jgi:transposase